MPGFDFGDGIEDTVQIDVDRFVAETEKALLFEIDDDDFWVPKSVTVTYEDTFVVVDRWWAEKQGYE